MDAAPDVVIELFETFVNVVDELHQRLEVFHERSIDAGGHSSFTTPHSLCRARSAAAQSLALSSVYESERPRQSQQSASHQITNWSLTSLVNL